MLSVPVDLYKYIFISPAEVAAAACTCVQMSRRARMRPIFTKKPLLVAPYNTNDIVISSLLHTYEYDSGLSKVKLWYDGACVYLMYAHATRGFEGTIVGYSPKTQLYAAVGLGSGADYSTFVWLWRVFGLDWVDLPQKL